MTIEGWGLAKRKGEYVWRHANGFVREAEDGTFVARIKSRGEMPPFADLAEAKRSVEAGIDQRLLGQRLANRRRLTVIFDVTDLTEAEVDYLAGELAAQAERSEGHPSLAEPTVEVLDSDTADAVDAILERLASHLVVAPGPDATVDAWCDLLATARRRLKDARA